LRDQQKDNIDGVKGGAFLSTIFPELWSCGVVEEQGVRIAYGKAFRDHVPRYGARLLGRASDIYNY